MDTIRNKTAIKVTQKRASLLKN